MSQQFDKFCEDLRLKLANVDSGLHGLKSKIGGKAHNAEQEVRNHLEMEQRRMEQNRAKIAAARNHVKDWIEERKIDTTAMIAEWKARHEIGKLQVRASKAEHYAEAALEVALAAIDEAGLAALEAWLARQDANVGQTNKA